MVAVSDLKMFILSSNNIIIFKSKLGLYKKFDDQVFGVGKINDRKLLRPDQ